MASHSSASDNFSRIGSGTVIRGTLRGSGDVEIEGRVEGVVDVQGDVTLQTTARVRIEDGALAGSRVTVRGAVLGSIRGETSVVLEDGARVVGDLVAPTIGIRPGGLLRGHVSTGDAPDSQALTRGRAERAPARATPARAPRAVAAPAPRPKAPSPKATARAATPRAVEEPVYVEPVEAPRGRSRRDAAPAPVMPSLRKGAKGQMKRKGAK
ncbi:MAG: polymer-forming cytoskeletal protein [Polyangiaceae bacterium]|jgi:cytoskeletal protein CcmA (bactofilin family)|nr:polymer-forming cytoskeletal protein [Polyangiaceae bacterium]